MLVWFVLVEWLLQMRLPAAVCLATLLKREVATFDLVRDRYDKSLIIRPFRWLLDDLRSLTVSIKSNFVYRLYRAVVLVELFAEQIVPMIFFELDNGGWMLKLFRFS